MKKILFFLLVCVFTLPYVWGVEEVKERKFEMGFNVNAGFANDFLSIGDVFREVFVLDLDKLKNGLKMNLGFGATPLYFNYNNTEWGFGLSINTEAIGILNLSGKLLSFDEIVNDKSEISGAAFADIAPSGFFRFHKVKIKFKPALYFPVAYVKSDILYTLNSTTAGTVLNLDYGMNVFTAFPTENSAGFKLSARPGVDFYLGAEYPLSDALGISDKIFFLDFDVGLDLINIPLIPSVVRDYMKIDGRIGSDKPVNFFSGDGFDTDSFFSTDNDIKYGIKEETVLRPFKMLAWANWRPFGMGVFTAIPTLGFAINPLYTKAFSLEAGLKARLRFYNFFTVTAGMGYHDRLWKNSIDFGLNLRAFELNIGADLRSPKFTKSWSSGGFGLNFGLRFGW